MADGASCFIALTIGTFQHTAVYKLTSGGEFRLPRIVRDQVFEAAKRSPRGSIGFELIGASSAENLDQWLAAEVEAALKLSPKARRDRLAAAPRLPAKQVVTTTVFIRNAYVIAAVLARAKGICERCGSPAPFLRQSDGSPFLEVHHVKMLAEGGEDMEKNAMALCPNCHRQRDHGVG